jgi:hypothetical protein
VSVDEPPALTTVGLIAALSPLGDEIALRLIASAVPVPSVVLIVFVPLLPWTTVRLLGLAEMAKSDGAAVTFTVTDTLCVLEGATPVTVTVYAPGATVADAVTVSVEPPPAVTELGLSVAVTPAGELADSETVSADPLVTAVLMALVAPAPCTTVRLVGLAEIEKSFGGTGATVTVTEAVCVAEPSVPVTVNVYVPGAVVSAGETVRVDDPPAVTAVGLRVAAIPFGDEVTLRLIVPAVPVTSAVLTVLVPDWPCTTVRLLGLAAIEKSDGAAVTLTNTCTRWKTGPSVPTASRAWRPTGTAGPTTIVIVEPPPAVTEVGLKLAVSPGSVEVNESAIVPGVPMAVVLIAVVTLEPWTALRLVGLAEIVKSLPRPTPCSGSDFDPPATFPVNTREPKRSPAAVGVNVTNTRQNMPAARGFGALGQ